MNFISTPFLYPFTKLPWVSDREKQVHTEAIVIPLSPSSYYPKLFMSPSAMLRSINYKNELEPVE